MARVPAHAHPEYATDAWVGRLSDRLAALEARVSAIEGEDPADHPDLPGDLVLASPDGTEWTLSASDAGEVAAIPLQPEDDVARPTPTPATRTSSGRRFRVTRLTAPAPNPPGESTPGPVISNIQVLSITPTSVRITWDLDQPGTGYVEYGTTTSYGSETVHEDSYTWSSHSQPISGLSVGTTYHFRIHSSAPSGDPVETISPDQSFATPTPATGIYGPGIGGDSLANTTLGTAGSQDQLVSIDRFRAPVTASLDSVTVYWLGADDNGYSGGDPAHRFAIYALDGQGYPTGSALATEDFASGYNYHDADRVVTFSPAPALTAGTRYCLYAENTDASPSSKFFALDRWCYLDGGSIGFPGATNPRFADADWSHAYKETGGAWVERPGYTPIVQYAFSDGTRHGQCYGEASYGSGEVGRIEGGSRMVRERFTVSGGSRTVTGAGIRILRLPTTSSALTVRLEDDSGALIDSFDIAASAVATGPAPDGTAGDDTGLGRQARWVEGTFASSRTLSDGTTYRLRLSTTGGAYYAWVNRRLNYGYSNYDAATAFADGVGSYGGPEYTTDGGSNWSGLGSATNKHDLQFFFRTV